jgi:PKD repeat protein
MKVSSLVLAAGLGLSFLQDGCSNAQNSNQPPSKSQNLVITSNSTAQQSPTGTTTSGQNQQDNELTEEEARPMMELAERCKHAPIGKAIAEPMRGSAPLKVVFDGSKAYDPDGTKIVEWKWLFGNGESARGRNITYTYEKPGRYGIGLDVTDVQGQKTSDCGTGATDIIIVVTDSQNKRTSVSGEIRPLPTR